MNRRLLVPSAAAIGCVALAALPAAGLAAANALPATSGALKRCSTTVYTLGSLPVVTGYIAVKGAKPSHALLSCANANAVAKAGKRYYEKAPFVAGKKVTSGGVTYTLDHSIGGRWGGLALSGPLYGWVGGGVEIPLFPGG